MHLPVSWSQTASAQGLFVWQRMQLPRQTMNGDGHAAQWPVASQTPEQHSALDRQFAPRSRQFPWTLQSGSTAGHVHSNVVLSQKPRQQSAFARQFSPMSRQPPWALQSGSNGGHVHWDVVLSQ
jgi:hypothetical protein